DPIAQHWNASADNIGLSLPAVLITRLKTEAQHSMYAHLAITNPAHRAWTVEHHGKAVSLGEKADRVLVLFNRVKPIGDIVVNVDPLHAGIPWAGLRLILEVATADRQQMRALLDGMEVTVYMINRLKAYLEYSAALPQNPATTNFEAAIVNFYAFVLRFLAKSIRIYEKESVVRFLQAFAQIGQGNDFQTECAEHERRTEAEAAICERLMSQMDRHQAKSLYDDFCATIGEIQAIRNVAGSIDRLHKKIDLLALRPVEGAAFDSYAAEETAMCLANTRVDFLKSVMNWADDSNGSCIYWLKGMAGTGKSTIARTVADMLNKKQMLGASFFFKRGEADRSSSRKLFPTLASQLAARLPSDISVFLDYQFAKIRASGERGLPSDWPGRDNIRALADMASPLFIYAATISRFIADPTWDADDQLGIVLRQFNQVDMTPLAATYTPVLDRLLHGQNQNQQDRIARAFREIVGSIVTLFDPLSVDDLSILLAMPGKEVRLRLGQLHSVLSVPSSGRGPVRLLHLSFRDFLVDREQIGESVFRIDSAEAHWQLVERCLSLLDKPEVLKRDLCNVQALGYRRAQVTDRVLAACIPTTVSYACRYWVAHLTASERKIIDHDIVSKFLVKRFLHWVEALSWLGEAYSLMNLITTLQSCVHATDGGTTTSLLNDAKYWITQYRRAMGIAPLQIYACALEFLPKQSVVRSLFGSESLQRVSVSDLPEYWSTPNLILEARRDFVMIIAFSPDGQLLASASEDHTVPPLGHRGWPRNLADECGDVSAVKLSPGGQWLAIQLREHIEFWDSPTMQCHCCFTLHNLDDFEFITDEIVMYSPFDQPDLRLVDIQQHANKRVKPLCTSCASGDERATCVGENSGHIHRREGDAGAYNAHTTSLRSSKSQGNPEIQGEGGATIDDDLALRANSINLESIPPDGIEGKDIEDDTYIVGREVRYDGKELTLKSLGADVAIYPGGCIIALGDRRDSITLREFDQTSRDHYSTTTSFDRDIGTLLFRPDGRTLATVSCGGEICLWDVQSQSVTTRWPGSRALRGVRFSPDGGNLASFDSNDTATIWNIIHDAQEVAVLSIGRSFDSCALSNGGRYLACRHGGSVEVCRAVDSSQIEVLKTGWDTNILIFSAYSDVLAVSNHDSVTLYDPAAGNVRTIKTGERVRHLRFLNENLIAIDHQVFDVQTTKEIKADLLDAESRARSLTSHLSISADDQWIQQDGADVLWLPPERRPRHYRSWSSHCSTIVIANGPGFTFIEFESL
ncbi:vegetative incompatibility protein HET-E-1, partial [Teratosphaeria destructans]